MRGIPPGDIAGGIIKETRCKMTALRGLVLPLLALTSVIMTALYIVDLVRTSGLSSGCEMTYSWPVYTPIDNLKELPAHRKYSLHAVHMQTAREQLTGVPVLFVPGHMGSYKQARSIARHLWDIDHERFDVFAVDFQQELTGLNGRFVDEQAHYVNEAVRAILKQYQKQIRQQNKVSTKKRVAPDNVVIVAHSMGGVVVRSAELLPNYKRRSIQHVVSFGSPYEQPPFPFDADAQSVYSRIDKAISSTTTPLSSTVYVSIAGGHKDTTVHASMSLADRILAPSSPQGLSLLASKMPHVGLTLDHLCLVWCHQLLKRVALSLDAIVDRDARAILKDEDTRLELARLHLLLGSGSDQGDVEVIDSHTSHHRQALIDGYHSVDEFTTYGMLLPQPLVRLFRARHMTLFWIMYLLVVHIFHIQLTHWQRRFDLQGESPSSASPSPSTLKQEHFPSFTSLLHPLAHAPGFVKTAIAFIETKLLESNQSKRTTILGGLVGGFVLLVSAGFEMTRHYAVVKTTLVQALELTVLYVDVVGLLYVMSLVLSTIRVIVQPLVRVALAIARRTRAKRWFLVSIIYFLVQLLGHVRDFELLPLDSAPRHLALLVLGSVVVFVVHVVELGVKLENLTSDQQRYRATLFALFTLSTLPWIGQVVYYLDVVRFPATQLTNEFLIHSTVAMMTLALFRYFITATDSEMAPLPPTAFFDNADGTDDDDDNGDEAKAKITAENCPRCVFEDGGPGAVFIEYENRLSTHKIRTKHNELVVVGTTFRVVSCDCVLRFKTTREYCEFCTRSCRLCGGGSGNFAQAQKYRDFLEQSKMEVALHAVVALSLELVVLILMALKTEHYIGMATPVIILILTLYHGLLRHPIEANKLKKELRKRQKKANDTKKKKSKKKPAAARRRASQRANATTSTAKPNNNKSSGNGPASLMEEYGATESVR